MISKKAGKSISKIEVLGISRNGIWIIVLEKEYFLPFSEFPWFEDANLSSVFNVELAGETHIYWPDLDVDLEIGSIENPKAYPLVSKKRKLKKAA